LTLDGTLNVTPLTGFGPGTYRLIDYVGTLTNNGLDINLASLPANMNAAIDLSTPNQVNLVISAITIPEPSTLVLGSVGLLGLALLRCRRGR
jgi:fibronectin-binding autotransporter adhesin